MLAAQTIPHYPFAPGDDVSSSPCTSSHHAPLLLRLSLSDMSGSKSSGQWTVGAGYLAVTRSAYLRGFFGKACHPSWAFRFVPIFTAPDDFSCIAYRQGFMAFSLLGFSNGSNDYEKMQAAKIIFRRKVTIKGTTYIQDCRRAYTTDSHHQTEMLRRAAAVDVQTIAAALIALIYSLASGIKRVQHYRAVQDVTIAAKHTLTRNKCLRANIKVHMCYACLFAASAQRANARCCFRWRAAPRPCVSLPCAATARAPFEKWWSDRLREPLVPKPRPHQQRNPAIVQSLAHRHYQFCQQARNAGAIAVNFHWPLIPAHSTSREHGQDCPVWRCGT